MEFNNVGKLMRFIPTKKDIQSVDSSSCNILQHIPPRDIWPEMLGKICYVTKKKLVIETRAVESKPGEKTWGATQQVAGDGLTEITTLRMKRNLGHNGFLIKDTVQIGKGMMRFTAERMPEMDWDEVTPLWKYPENVVVNTPLYYPQFMFLFRKIDALGVGWGKWYKINHLIKGFKPWLFAPTYFCIMCGKHHQGTHRICVAREFEMPTIKVRIIKHWWTRRMTIPKGLEYYLDNPMTPLEHPSSVVPYEKFDKRLIAQKHLAKPSKVYQKWLKLPAADRAYKGVSSKNYIIITKEKE